MSQTTGIVRSALDDRADLDDLYVRDMPDAVRLAALITGDPDLAQDIAHDAFLRSVGRFRHLRQPEAFEAYLRRAVVNACTSYFRRRKVEVAYLRGQARYPAPVDEPDPGRRARSERWSPERWRRCASGSRGVRTRERSRTRPAWGAR